MTNKSAPGVQELELDVRLRVKVKASTVNCDGRPYVPQDLAHAVLDCLEHELMYDSDSIEPTDLVQGILSLEVDPT